MVHLSHICGVIPLSLHVAVCMYVCGFAFGKIYHRPVCGTKRINVTVNFRDQKGWPQKTLLLLAGEFSMPSILKKKLGNNFKAKINTCTYTMYFMNDVGERPRFTVEEYELSIVTISTLVNISDIFLVCEGRWTGREQFQCLDMFWLISL